MAALDDAAAPSAWFQVEPAWMPFPFVPVIAVDIGGSVEEVSLFLKAFLGYSASHSAGVMRAQADWLTSAISRSLGRPTIRPCLMAGRGQRRWGQVLVLSAPASTCVASLGLSRWRRARRWRLIIEALERMKRL